jgi:hypothetical protein
MSLNREFLIWKEKWRGEREREGCVRGRVAREREGCKRGRSARERKGGGERESGGPAGRDI